jgi:hypothetical protein
MNWTDAGVIGTNWRSIPDLAHIGYPIAEVWESGEAVIRQISLICALEDGDRGMRNLVK